MSDNYGMPVNKVAIEEIEEYIKKDSATVVYFETAHVPKIGTLLSCPVPNEDFSSDYRVTVLSEYGKKVDKDAGTVFLGGITDFIKVWFKPEYNRRVEAVNKAEAAFKKRKVAFEEFKSMGEGVSQLIEKQQALHSE